MTGNRQISQPFLAVESDLLHICSIVCKRFDTLRKGNSWKFGLLPPALFHRTVPEQKNRPSRMWADFLTVVCSWLPSLLGSKMSTFRCTCLCSVCLVGLAGRAEGLGPLGKGVSKKDAFGLKVSGNVLVENDLFQWLCKP